MRCSIGKRVGSRWLALGLAVLALARPAVAATPLSTGSMLYSGSVIVMTLCLITNVGTKPVKITSVGIVNQVGPLVAADAETCTTAPLAPGTSCYFSGSAGVYGGGIASVSGSVKRLRGRCGLLDSGSLTVLSADMR